MKQAVICKILDAHGVPYRIRNGRIEADTMGAYAEVFEEVEDVTDFTRTELFDWLGY